MTADQSNALGVQGISDKLLIPTSPVHQYLLRIHIADQWGVPTPLEPKQILMQYETEAVLSSLNELIRVTLVFVNYKE